MSLPGEELRRRIVSAAALRGLGLRELRDALEAYGAPRTLAEAMIRGDQAQSARNVRDLGETLRVPHEWFTTPDFDAWLSRASAAPEPVGETQLLEMLSQLATGVESNHQQIQELQQAIALQSGRRDRGAGNA